MPGLTRHPASSRPAGLDRERRGSV